MLPYLPRPLLRSFRFLIVFCIVSSFILFSRFRQKPDLAGPRFEAQTLPPYSCPCSNRTDNYEHTLLNASSSLTEPRALVLVESLYSKHSKLIIQVLNAAKFPFKLETFSKNLPLLTTVTHGRFSVVIIENYYKYVNMPRWNRQLLDKYCKEYETTIVAFLLSREGDSFTRANIKGSQIVFQQKQRVSQLEFSERSSVPFIARPGVILEHPAPDSASWVLFQEHPACDTVLSALDQRGIRRAVVLRDKGMWDGVSRILFGQNLTQWMVKLAFLDALRFASHGRFGFDLNRSVQIDIDDVFVGARGTRMVEQDVRELLAAQQRIRTQVHNFTFTLGFSGSYFRNGDDLEDKGDELLIEMASNFYWFPHMWRHNHAHEHNQTYLAAIMTQNKLFAESMNLQVPFAYSISPQHAGVFPAHSALYEAWRKVWKVEVSATEEYPHLRPSSDRRGFIHKGIMVLPRQTCGLYTHTQLLHSYPDGVHRLMSNVYGGDLFFAVVLNPISIFMTHQQNFAHDRLAIWVFENAFRFISCWTRLRLSWADPISSAKKYFEMFPSEKTPVWSNPCVDPRHKTILPPAFNCSNMTLPNLLIVGPQKTGTTALSWFLSLHPNTSTNAPTEDSFEELQFFGGAHYSNGLEWYLDKFHNASVVFEKSATYFDNPKAPVQAAALVPNSKILVILYDPALRAYSWYQHLLAHNDTVAQQAGSFAAVLNATTLPLKRIRSRCLNPGKYSHHLDNWLEYFPSSQLILVEGQLLKEEPVSVMNKLSGDLQLPAFDYGRILRFSPTKGFWCETSSGKTRCLGGGKGRNYPPMDDSTRRHLNSLYLPDNTALHKMLVKYKMPVPSWLKNALASN